MRSKAFGLLSKSLVMAAALFLLMPATALAQRGRGRGKPTEVFVNGHDARDGRTDRDQRRGRRNRDDDWRDDDRRGDRRGDRRDDRRREGRRGRDWGNYGGWGGSNQLRQTA